MGVSKNSGTPKPSILIGFCIINRPFWGTLIFGNTHIYTLDNQVFSFLFMTHLLVTGRDPSCRGHLDPQSIHYLKAFNISFIWGFPKIGKHPKMDGENNGNSY